jgi:hypothetical protein
MLEQSVSTARAPRATRIQMPWLVIFFSALLVGLVWVASASLPAQIETRAGQAKGFFASDRRWVMLPGQCVTLSWQVENIRALYVNGVGKAGSGSEPFCLTRETTAATLTVHFQDGSVEDYVLPLTLLAFNPLAWGVLLLFAGIVIVALHLRLPKASALRFPRELLVAVPLMAALGVLVMLPLGFRLGPIHDTWQLQASIDFGSRPYYDTSYIPIRPLTYWPWLLAYLIDPNSFVGLNVMLLLALILKGLALYLLVRSLVPRLPGLALALGALILLYPADKGVFYLDAVNVHLGMALALLSLWLFVVYWQRPRLWSLLLMLGLQALTLGVYEGGVPWLACAPLLILLAEQRLSRRWFVVASMWWFGLAVWVPIFVYTLIANTSSYQSGLLNTGLSNSGLWLDRLLYAYNQTLWGELANGITYAVSALRAEFPRHYLVIAVLAGLSVGCIAWRFWPKTLVVRSRAWLGLALLGLVTIFLGLLMQLPTANFLNIRTYWRVLYYPSLGGVLTLAAVCGLVGTLVRRPRLTPVLLGVLTGVAMMSLVGQRQVFNERASNQQRIMRLVIEQVPTPPPLLVVIDKSPSPGISNYLEFNAHFEHGLMMVYQNSTVRARICYDNMQSTRIGRRCRFEDGQILVDSYWGDDHFYTFPIEQTIFFLYEGDNKMTLLETIPETYLSGADASAYNPRGLINADAPPPPRLFTMLERARP